MSNHVEENGLCQSSLYLNILPTMPLAMFPASPVVEKAVPAMLDAWLNLSHREKARELVMVRTIAIATKKNGQSWNKSSSSVAFFFRRPRAVL